MQEDNNEIDNPDESEQLATCFGGPLDGRDMPIVEPLDCETRYPDIYYESCDMLEGTAAGLFYQKIENEQGEEICHWYAMLVEPDPNTPTLYWKYYAYRGAHPEDAMSRPGGYKSLEQYPVVRPGFPEYEQED